MKYTITTHAKFRIVRIKCQVEFQVKAFRNDVTFRAIFQKRVVVLIPCEFVPSLGCTADRSNLFSQFNCNFAHSIWKALEYENFILHNNLSEIEKKKMRKTVRPPALPDHESVNNATPRRLARRFNKSLRRQRKREQFLAKRKSTPSETNDKLQHLNPVNLSELSLSEDQNKLLRKGPSFCPAPRDINWQEVHDDLESFEARLRTACCLLSGKGDRGVNGQESRPKSPAINTR